MANTITTGSPSNVSLSFTKLDSERWRKIANLIPEPSFMQDSDELPVTDDGGARRRIFIRGVQVDTPANLKTFTDDLEKLINGDQTPEQGFPGTFTSEFKGTVRVKFEDVEWEYSAGRPREVKFRITMLESDTIY